MTARCIEAAALTVALAGASGESVDAAFDPASRDPLVRAVRRLRPVGTRLERARALASAGLRLLRAPRAVTPVDDAVGARFIAAWMRSLDPADRDGFVRDLGAASLGSLRAALPSSPTFDAAQRSTATHLVDLTHRALSRAPTLSEWASLLGALSLRGSLADHDLLRTARAIRMSARADAFLALAAAVCAR